MKQSEKAALHDAYAADYDAQVQAYGCHIAEVLFGLCYATIRPGERLLDAGTGSGLSAELFAKAGLEIHGMDFAPAMLDLCRRKGFATDLRQHDLLKVPWPYPAGHFDHLICCGVLHFIPDLEGIVAEAARLIVDGGLFAFTTRLPAAPVAATQKYERQEAGELPIFSHEPETVCALLLACGFAKRKMQRCYVGEDLFAVWVAERNGRG